MYKLYSPKDYTFLGVILGLPTALFASYQNGKQLEKEYPQILRTAKKYIVYMLVLLGVVFTGQLFLNVSLARDIKLQAQTFANPATTASTYQYMANSYSQQVKALEQKYTREAEIFTWVMVGLQLGLLVLFVKEVKTGEMIAFDALKAEGKVHYKSRFSLVLFGIAMFIAYKGIAYVVSQLSLKIAGV